MIWLAWAFSAAQAQAAPPPALYAELESACTDAFVLASEAPKDEAKAGAASLCACVAHESRSQRATAQALKREAARMRENPKAQIEDPAVLASFHVCVIDAMHAAEAKAALH